MKHELGDILSCGCRIGSFDCPVACQLWEAVNAAYRSALASSVGGFVNLEAVAVYKANLAEYRAHFGEVPHES